MSRQIIKQFCTGCTACSSACPKGCITMVADQDGFLHPVIEAESCVNCGLCNQVCPAINLQKTDMRELKAYAAYSRDEAIRLQSSSGGIFTELAKAVLANKGTVFGAAYNEQFEVVHICAENEADIAKLRGAKYAQSNLCGIFPAVKRKLDEGQQVLFSGTPCQVGGLKAFLRKEYENLLTVDFVCHSVPSPVAWRKYVQYRAEQDNDRGLPLSINLRSKKTGWSKYQYSNLFDYHDFTHSAKSGESLYMKLFVGGYISRESCASCQFKGYSRVSDLTIGDFWGIWDIAPEMDDNKGTSVVLVQSDRGEALLRSIANQLVLKMVTLEEASMQNQAMIRTARMNPKRDEVLRMIRAENFDAIQTMIDKTNKQKSSFFRRMIRSALRLFGQ